MTDKEIEYVSKILNTARKAFPHCKADEETIALYIRMLQGLSVKEIEAAIFKCMKTARFFPTIAEILEAAESVVATANGTVIPDAGEAWQEAMENVRINGCYKPWKYSCPQVEKACKRFGISELLNLEANAVNTARAQFMRIYNEIIDRYRNEKINTQVIADMGAGAKRLIERTAKKLTG